MDNLLDTQTELTSTESSSKSEADDDTLDPRVQIELERLNHANEAINHLELQLNEARKTLNELWTLSATELSQLEKSIGSAVAKARSYYETRIKLRDAKDILTKAKHRFERAQALHVAAKELALISIEYIDEAEKSNQNAATWNETYRHAMIQAGDAEREKYLSDLDQQRAERVYLDIEKTLERLQKDFRRSINKSQPYYEMKAEYHKELEFQKRKVYGLENCVNEAKIQYQQSLRNLERISNEIHAQRNQGKISTTDLGEQTSDIHEEQIPEIKSPIVKQTNHTIHSCLLRTEELPSGTIITSTNFRYAPEGVETTNHVHNQFILRSKEAPHLTVINSSEQDNLDLRDRVASFSSQISQITDDDDNKSGSLHVLSDEQLNHLAYEHHFEPSEISYSTDPIDALLSQFESSTLQAKTFFRNLFKTNNLNN